jgi:hypothetical protein
MDLAPSSERLPSYRIDPRRSASLGIRPRVCPAFDIPVVRPLPGFVGLSRHCRSARVLPRTRTRSALVVSHHLDGLLRTQASGLLHPEAERGSLRFAMPPPPAAGRSHRSWAGAPFPATRFTPFEEFPSSAAVPRRRGHCPLAVAADNASSRTPKHTFVHAAVPMDRFRVPPTTEAVSATSSRAAFRASLRSRSLEICSERPATAGMRSLPCPSLPCGQVRVRRPALRRALDRVFSSRPRPTRTPVQSSQASFTRACGGVPTRVWARPGPATPRAVPLSGRRTRNGSPLPDLRRSVTAWLRYIGAFRGPGHCRSGAVAPSPTVLPVARRSLRAGLACGRSRSCFRCSRLQGLAPPTSP